MRLKTAHLVAAALLVSACAEPPPPRSVQEFVDNSILLEAALVRCAQNRTETRYEAECVNARAAGKIIEAREDAARREQFDAMSDQKLRARRETQAAAAEARRRAAEAQRLQEEAEYLAQFGELPPESTTVVDTQPETLNAQGAVVPQAPDVPSSTAQAPIQSPYDEEPVAQPAPPSTGANTPGLVVEETEEEPASDLQSIRDELKRRQDPP